MDELIHYDRVPVPSKKKHRLHRAFEIELFQELEERGDFELSPIEQKWAEEYDYLFINGYQLRPRFHPGWAPSWRGTNLSPVACEDSIVHYSRNVIDAKRLRDGKIVAIKKVPPFTFEAKIACFLSTPEHLEDPMNHCVPVLDHFPDTRDPYSGSFIVMPLLRDFNDPPFAYVEEVADFVSQTLEAKVPSETPLLCKGLVYIHSQNVTHRDLSDGNIMMDGRAMYGEKGFHPSDQDLTAGDMMAFAKPKARRDAGFVKYHFTDFGLSLPFDDPKRPRLAVGNLAQDSEVPELSSVIPYDPFAVDVFTLGNVYKRHFLEKYANVEFLSPLCAAMTEQIPELRPSAVEALAMFRNSISDYHGTALRWRLRKLGEPLSRRIVRDLRSGLTELIYQAKLPFTFLFKLRNGLVRLTKA